MGFVSAFIWKRLGRTWETMQGVCLVQVLLDRWAVFVVSRRVCSRGGESVAYLRSKVNFRKPSPCLLWSCQATDQFRAKQQNPVSHSNSSSRESSFTSNRQAWANQIAGITKAYVLRPSCSLRALRIAGHVLLRKSSGSLLNTQKALAILPPNVLDSFLELVSLSVQLRKEYSLEQIAVYAVVFFTAVDLLCLAEWRLPCIGRWVFDLCSYDVLARPHIYQRSELESNGVFQHNGPQKYG